jgi:hypothetical protein
LNKNIPASLQPSSASKGTLASGQVSNVAKLTKTAAAKSEKTPAKELDAQILRDDVQALDPALSEKEQKKEIRRMKKNGAGRIHTAQRTNSMNIASSDILDRSVKTSSPTRNNLQIPSEISPPLKPIMSKVRSQDGKSNLKPNVESASKKSKKLHSKPITTDQGGKPPEPSHGVPLSTPSPRKTSVILPPKFTGSLTR